MMNVLICGAGKVGRSLIKYLSNDYMLTVVDPNLDNLNDLSSEFEVKTICGQSSDPYILKKADIEKIDIVISALQDDDENLFVCHICASLFNVEKRIARITNPNILFFRDSILNAFSVNSVISPELEIANYIAAKVNDFYILENVKAFNGEISILSISVTNPNFNEIKAVFANLNVILIAVLRGKKILDHLKLEELVPKDSLLIVIQTKNITELVRAFQDNGGKNFVIIGGGKIGFFLAQKLEEIKSPSEITIIEQNKDRAQFLAEKLTRTSIMNCNGVDPNTLEEIDIDENAVIISVTNNDQVNIFSQLLLKNSNVKESIALLQDESYAKLAGSIGIKNVISPDQIMIDSFSKLIINIDKKNDSFLKYNLCNDLFIFLEIELVNTDIIEKVKGLPDSAVKNVMLFKHDKLILFDKNNSNLEMYDKILICVLSGKVEQLLKYFR